MWGWWSSWRRRRRRWRRGPSLRRRCRCGEATRGSHRCCLASAGCCELPPCLTAHAPTSCPPLQACSDEVLHAGCTRLAASMGGGAAPLAKAVPLVAALGGELLSPAGRPPLARLEPVRSLSARVYGCCFCEA